MKYISFAIPCYNSEAYMEKSDQLNPYRRRRCRNSYRQRWFKRRNAGNRRTVRSSISDDRQGDPKENGGHGDAVNCGLSHATGKVF